MFKSVAVDIIKSSTAHGLPNIVDNESKLFKVLWLLAFIASTAMCAWLISVGIMNYVEFEVVTKVEIRREAHALFPAITICKIFNCSYLAYF